jgi:A/G-specific adenine glycosylase
VDVDIDFDPDLDLVEVEVRVQDEVEDQVHAPAPVHVYVPRGGAASTWRRGYSSPVRISPARRAALRRRLLSWYDAGRRALPWRFPQHGADPYRVWIAEVMLQQTQVRTAIPRYARFVARFPSLAALAAAPEEEVLAEWSGLGYYARARNLHAAAREALRRHGGLPASVEALRALPGIGPYTAGAVASIAFAVPAPAVDGNVARVLARLFLVRGDLASGRGRARLDALARALVDERRPGDLNQALMDLGATVCGKPVPRCAGCPVASLCAARAAGSAADVPPARWRAARRALVLACALVRRGDLVLLERRPPGGLFARLWGLPAAEVPSRGDPRAALARTLLEAHGLRARVGEEVAVCERTLTHRRLTLRAFRCTVPGRLPLAEPLRLATPAGLERLGIPSAMRMLLEKVAAASEG